MTKEEIFLTLMSLTVGQYEMQGKSVLVEPITILGMCRGKRITIRENYQSLSFTLLFNRRSYYTIEDIVVRGDIQDLEDFIGSLLPEPSTFELRRESLEILLLILLIISILSTPVTIVTFIYQYAWAWGLLAFTTTMFIWSAWIYYKIGKLP